MSFAGPSLELLYNNDWRLIQPKQDYLIQRKRRGQRHYFGLKIQKRRKTSKESVRTNASLLAAQDLLVRCWSVFGSGRGGIKFRSASLFPLRPVTPRAGNARPSCCRSSLHSCCTEYEYIPLGKAVAVAACHRHFRKQDDGRSPSCSGQPPLFQDA